MTQSTYDRPSTNCQRKPNSVHAQAVHRQVATRFTMHAQEGPHAETHPIPHHTQSHAHTWGQYANAIWESVSTSATRRLRNLRTPQQGLGRSRAANRRAGSGWSKLALGCGKPRPPSDPQPAGRAPHKCACSEPAGLGTSQRLQPAVRAEAHLGVGIMSASSWATRGALHSPMAWFMLPAL